MIEYKYPLVALLMAFALVGFVSSVSAQSCPIPTWATGISYTRGQVATVNGYPYASRTAHTSSNPNSPADNTNWAPVAFPPCSFPTPTASASLSGSLSSIETKLTDWSWRSNYVGLIGLFGFGFLIAYFIMRD